MIFQSAMSTSVAESAFRSVVSGITATSADPVLQEGEPVILATAGTPLGQAVIRAATVTAVINRLNVGSVIGSIAHESAGLVQVYGVGPVRLAEAATVAAGDRLLPDLNSTATALAPYGRGAWIARTITDSALHLQSGAAIIVVAPATAVSGTTGYTNGQAFIRAL